MLDALRDELRERKYVPILFDFDKPTSQTRDETITLLARMSRDAGGVPGPGVVRTIGALVRRQRSPGELQHFCWAIRHQQQPCIMWYRRVSGCSAPSALSPTAMARRKSGSALSG